MRTTAVVMVYVLMSLLIGCTPVERQAYNTVVGAKAFLDSVKAKHPECPDSGVLCNDLSRATAAKDLLVDAIELYCASAEFENGAACTPPNKSEPAYVQGAAKLRAAINGYAQAEVDLKGVLRP